MLTCRRCMALLPTSNTTGRCRRHAQKRVRKSGSAGPRLPGLRGSVRDLLASRSPREAAEDEADFRRWLARIGPVVAEVMERRGARVLAELPRQLKTKRGLGDPVR